MRGPADGLWHNQLKVEKLNVKSYLSQFVLFLWRTRTVSRILIQQVVPDEVSTHPDRFSYPLHPQQYKQWYAFLKLRKN